MRRFPPSKWICSVNTHFVLLVSPAKQIIVLLLMFLHDTHHCLLVLLFWIFHASAVLNMCFFVPLDIYAIFRFLV